ncbi:hypothetical protein [Neorickettsia sennetsu]|uniref:Uncharacterized protein n=1 Tax=Ehrlichia sennetsu (strain ATCC VR-367 / Miyayama) TaxID=222891 RepID=Q2GCU0_EHRS3|nr:hypothetical protein [Neorickettsia sennetsu]ABD45802.1 hypothetical protein NSE_0838 [Neorickettsia sennetsu str. Miyayama]
MPAFSGLATPDRILAAGIQAAADVASFSECRVLCVVHTPRETSPLRIAEDLRSLRECRESLPSLLGKGIPLVVVHNPS